MDIVVIGGTGHIGGHLGPQLATAGHGVTVISRGHRRPWAAAGQEEAAQGPRRSRQREPRRRKD